MKLKKKFNDNYDEMKAKLSKLFPYNVEPLTFEELEYLDTFFFVKQEQLEPQTQTELLKIYNRVFNQRRQATSCTPCWVAILEELKVLQNQYKI